MTTQQKIKLNMYLAVRNFGLKNEQVVKTITKFASAFAKLLECIKEIQVISELQGQNKTGRTSDKNNLKKKLVKLALKNLNMLAILAKQSGSDTLMKEIWFNESDLQRFSDVVLLNTTRTIYERVEAHQQELTEQGVTPEALKIYSENLSAFNALLAIPRTGITETRIATQKLTVLFSEADSSIEIMDFAAASIKDEKPDFYNGYKNSRILVEISSGTITLKASAKDFLSGFPLPGTKFIFKSNSGTIKKKTSEKGNFYIKHITPGTYTVEIVKKGYRQKTETVTVSDGEKTEMKVELEKA